jgi:hypothetical protein
MTLNSGVNVFSGFRAWNVPYLVTSLTIADSPLFERIRRKGTEMTGGSPQRKDLNARGQLWKRPFHRVKKALRWNGRSIFRRLLFEEARKTIGSKSSRGSEKLCTLAF